MESYRIENLSFKYPNSERNTLSGINLKINQGEFITICGKSGSGKTTLLRLLKSALAPNGEVSGKIFFESGELSSVGLFEQAQKIGFVMQNPDNQIVTDKVWHELAFSLENLGIKSDEIRARVAEIASFFGISDWFYENTSSLSGGQKQLLNLASVMVLNPSVLILDEPTSQLDPVHREEFLNILKKINRELCMTVILAEHRLDDVFAMSDKVLVLEDGKVLVYGDTPTVASYMKESSHDMHLAMPVPVRVWSAVKDDTPCPLTVKDGREWLNEYALRHDIYPERIPKDNQDTLKDEIISFSDVWFKYEKDAPYIIKGMDISVNKGEIFTILGGNSAGKTTTLNLLSGLLKARRGKIIVGNEKTGSTATCVLPQNPQTVFLKNTVYSDLLNALDNASISKEEKDKKIKEISSLCQIEKLLSSHPYDLSGGEVQKAALAKILLKEPEILLFDEPTKGFDAHFKQIFAKILLKLKQKGKTIVLVSHDIEFCAEVSDVCALLFDGKIVAVKKPREFFTSMSFYTTPANQMAKTTLKEAVLADDIILACGGKTEKKQSGKDEFFDEERKDKKPKVEEPKEKIKKKTKSAPLILLLLIPLVMIFGTTQENGRTYIIASVIIMILTMLLFFAKFEWKKPKTREIVLICVLSALCVASRAAFFMLPQFKPALALVIISGICLGGETGFLIGATAALVSNFFLGQGPWTPWHMFVFGLIGYISGALFEKNQKNKILISVFGFFATLILYGGIMNPASVIILSGEASFDMIKASFITGFPFDLVHAFATFLFLLILSGPMTEKIERIKLKYGI